MQYHPIIALLEEEFLTLEELNLITGLDVISNIENRGISTILFGKYLNRDLYVISLKDGTEKSIYVDTGKCKKELTKTETKIVEFISTEALSNKEIAEKIGCSERTIETHVRSIFMKLNLNKREQIILNFRK
jgi:DNA-binding NarL/FixJ family response regulator